ncbi:MAG TPA: hypothetical protein VLL08_17985 [Kineosporiaceae bacterium]|nr:hypothetical protein [Kineosporiaceae bacterium]
MILGSRQVNPLAIAGVGAAIIAVLIGTALHPPGGRSGLPFSSHEWISVADPVVVSCPEVAGRLPARPVAARTGVTAELAKLERQIVDVNRLLVRFPEQANEQLAKIADERLDVIERIIADITRAGGTAPGSLKDLAECSLQSHAVGSFEAAAAIGNTSGAEEDDVEPTKRPTKTAPAKRGAKAGAGSSTGGSASHADDDDESGATDKPAEKDDDAEADSGAEDSGTEDSGAGAQTVQCPSVKARLSSVPSAAAAEVDQNLAELKQQIAEADAGIAELIKHPVDDANFIQNTILGPLRDRRVATIDRITIAIGRVTTAPTGLAALAPCTFEG